ncbi:MAG TPA: class I SAM-dependent methyltransferase [Nitrososphaerales archaeon]|nr:class I SAM-dependent methyltransferase [Nitrososphaerales archaeon]
MTAFFNDAYRGTPPWDIGKPQAEFVNIFHNSEITGKVLDIGCGTGENAIFFAGQGLEVWGLDAAPLAIQKAKKKALERAVRVEFTVGDALHLENLKMRFDTITDCGLFHTFSDEDRKLFVRSIKEALNKSGTYFMLCFSDKEPADWGGPRRVSKDEIVTTFGTGWKINYIQEARFSTTFNDVRGYAWLSSISLV